MEKYKNAQVIGNNLKKIRVSQYGWTQKEFADYIGMSVQNLSQTERGIYKPGLDKLLSIAEILQITPNDLLLDSSNNNSSYNLSNTNQKIKEFKEELEINFDPHNKKNSLLINSTIDILNFMSNWEPYRSAAKKAQKDGDSEKERAILQFLADQLATENSEWKKFVDNLYLNQLDSLVKKSSSDFQGALIDEQLEP